MIPEKSILEQLLEWLKTLPTWLKNAIVITGLLAGFVVSFRADKYLYTVIVIGIGILYISGLATYILLKRDPSPFGGKGAYKYYQYRFLAKGVLIAMLVGTIFLLSLHQSQEYISYAVQGTPTLAPSPTAAPSAIPDNIDKLLKISSSWDQYCATFVIFDDSDWPSIEKEYYDLSKSTQGYIPFLDRLTRLHTPNYAGENQNWEYFGLSLLLSGDPEIVGTITLENEIRASAIFSPANSMINILDVFVPGCGGGELATGFSPIHLFPEINVLSKTEKFDYFSVAPNETLYLTFDLICEAPGTYNLEFKIPYVYQGKRGEYKYLDDHSILCPKAFSFYKYLVDGAFQRSPHRPNSSIFAEFEEPLPGNEVLGKLTKMGEYHLTSKGNFAESLDWLPKDEVPPVPFWRMTVFNNPDFEGVPTYIGNIKIKRAADGLDTYSIKFSSAEFGKGIIPNNSNYSVALESEQHFFGGNYKVCMWDDGDGITVGTVQVDIDNRPAVSIAGKDGDCSEDFYVSNGSHVIKLKFVKNDSSIQDVNFDIYFENNSN